MPQGFQNVSDHFGIFILKGERKFSQESSIVDGEHSGVSIFNFDK